MAKVIILDFWGTLVDNGVYSPLKQIKQILGLDFMDYSEFVSRLERVMMTQRFDQLREAFEAVCREFGVSCDDKVAENLIGIWNKNWLLAKPYDETVEILQKLKEKHKLVLISNTDCFSVDAVLDKFEMRQYFDLMILSYEECVLKNDPLFYQKIFEKLEVLPEDCLAVGDSIETDVAAAQQAGVRVLLVDRGGRRMFPSKIRGLRELLEWT